MRHTLLAPVGENMLYLEAPQGMCFLDTTYRIARQFVTATAESLGPVYGGTLLGVFAPCEDLRAVDKGGSMPVSGTVTWLNRTVGDTTPLSRADYLDMQEVQFRHLLAEGLAGGNNPGYTADTAHRNPLRVLRIPDASALYLDSAARRTPTGVAVSYGGSLTQDFVEYAVSGVTATTMVKNIPIAVTFHYAYEVPYGTDSIHTMADEFLAQQIALNEQ